MAGVVQPVGVAVQSAVGEDTAAGFLGGDTRPVERAGDGAASRHHGAMGEGGGEWRTASVSFRREWSSWKLLVASTNGEASWEVWRHRRDVIGRLEI